ncbi:MAG TPA: FliM/FliN family flagellar motor switch protein [Terriglobia bacterium]|nr:FliM/FliN family flagellar motor switch protein [Terriglobia bacterium]
MSATTKPGISPAGTPISLSPEIRATLDQLKPFRTIPLDVSVELGTARLTLRDLLGLRYHSVFTLDQSAGAKLRITVNGVPLATGEPAVLGDRVGIKIDEVFDSER